LHTWLAKVLCNKLYSNPIIKERKVSSKSLDAITGLEVSGTFRAMAADGGWGWMVVLGSCVCHFFLLGINRSMGLVFVLLQERFEASATDTALAASIFVSVRAFGGR